MDYRGPDLEADLESIWETATKDFPEMAASYRAANVALHLTYTNSTKLDAKFLDYWQPLRDECEIIFGDDARTLDDTAQALCDAVSSFATEDAAAAAAVDSVNIDLTDEPPALAPPLYPADKAPHGYVNDLPSRPDYAYNGNAPTITELLDKAAETDNKLEEAMYAEMSWTDYGIVTISEIFGEEYEAVAIVKNIESLKLDNAHSFQGALGSLHSIDDNKESGHFVVFNTEIENAKLALNPDKWSGTAARSFTENFLNTYPDVSTTQAALIEELKAGIKGYQDATATTLIALKECLDQAITAFNAIIEKEGAKTGDVTMGAFSAAASAAVTAAEDGKAGIVFALADYAIKTGVKEVLVGETGTIGGETVDLGEGHPCPRTALVKMSLVYAIEKAYDRLVDFDEKLSKAMKKDYEAVRDGRYDPSRRLFLPRPKIADDSSAL